MKKKFNPVFEISSEENHGTPGLVVITICSIPIQVSPRCQV